MTWLFDGNVLTALVLEGHVHHARVKQWMAGRSSTDNSFATCATTQGTLLRLHMMYASDILQAPYCFALGRKRQHFAISRSFSHSFLKTT